MKNDNFEQSHSAEKSEKGPFGIFKHLLCSKISKKLKGDPLVQSKTFRSLIVPKKIQVKNTQIAKVGILFFRGSGRRFYK